MNLKCPHCRNACEVVPETSVTEITCPRCHNRFRLEEFMTDDSTMTETELFHSSEKMPKLGDFVEHYEIRRVLGRGGFGTVFAALDTKLQREVALKIPQPERMTGWQADVFLREARSAAAINHPHIVSVYEIGSTEKWMYIASELVQGITLNHWMHQHKPSFKESAKLCAMIARAIHSAHLQKVIHRDLKPTNIIIDAHHEPHITDLGLAKRDLQEEFTITTAGSVIGTPAYMSPEQARGESKKTDSRTDVYSIGVILYELLTGNRPFIGDSQLLIEQVRSSNPIPPRRKDPTIPRELEAICLKAMAKSPEDRFQTALSLADDLERFVSGKVTLTRPPGAIALVSRSLRSNFKTLASLTAVALLFCVIWVVYALGRNSRTNDPPPDPSVSLQNSPLAKRVIIETMPEHARIGIAPVDEFEIPDLEQAFVLPEVSPCEVKLPPGKYMIEAVIKGYGLQRVIRTVSDSSFNSPAIIPGAPHPILPRASSTKSSSKDMNIIILPQIRIAKESRLKDKMVLIAGGSFKPQNGYTALKSDGSVTVDSFWLQSKETTCGEFYEVMGYYPERLKKRFPMGVDPDLPIVFVTYYEAMEYAEREGLIIPSCTQFEYAATNGGTTKLPWGEITPVDEKFNNDEWIIMPCSEHNPDRTSSDVFDLCSNAIEWTGAIPNPYAPEDPTRRTIDSQLLEYMKALRVITGNPLNTTPGKSPKPSTETIEFESISPIEGSNNERLGFRVGAIAEPLIVK